MFGRKIEQNKIINQTEVLKQIRNKSEYLKEGINLLENLSSTLKSETDYLTIMGIEGNAAKIYFPRMFENVK